MQLSKAVTAASRKGNSTGEGLLPALWRGTVTELHSSGLAMVTVPRLAGNQALGPMPVMTSGLSVGDPVMVGAVEGRREDLVVTGRYVPGSTAHTHPVADISDSTATGRALVTAVDAAAARQAIGASSLTLGSTSTTAKAGNWVPAWDQVTGKPSTFTPAAHTHTPAQVGLGNVDNTSDLTKPISTAVATALAGKADSGHSHALLDSATVSAVNDTLVKRSSSGNSIFQAVYLEGSATTAKMATTKEYVDGQVAGRAATGHTHGLDDITITELGSAQDLNDYTTTRILHQSANAEAANGTNYPVPLAGLLEVWAYSNMVYQRYTEYSSGTTWVRSRYNTTWYPWRQLSDTNHSHPLLDSATASDVPNTLVRRNSGGRVVLEQIDLVDAPDAPQHATTKGYVDAALNFDTPTKTADDPPSAYPVGFSHMDISTGGGWPTTYATITTVINSTVRGWQTVTQKSNSRMWIRTVGDNNWGPFREVVTDAPASWANVSITHSSVESYSPGVSDPKVTRNGNLVTLYGELRTKVDGTVNSGVYAMNVPSGFRPAPNMPGPVFVCQGSGENRWTMRCYDNGNLLLERYGPTNDTAGSWLPFYVHWIGE